MSDHVLQLLYDQFDGLLARLRDLGVDTSERAALWAFVCIACQGMPGQDEHMLQRALEALTSVPTLVGMGFPERGAIAAVVRRGNLQDALTSLTAGEQSFDAGVAEYDEVTDFAADLRRPITAVLHRATEAEAIKIAARLRINNVTGEFLAIASYFAQASRLGQFFQEYVQVSLHRHMLCVCRQCSPLVALTGNHEPTLLPQRHSLHPPGPPEALRHCEGHPPL